MTWPKFSTTKIHGILLMVRCNAVFDGNSGRRAFARTHAFCVALGRSRSEDRTSRLMAEQRKIANGNRKLAKVGAQLSIAP